jgi:hypothetical protein
VSAAYLEKQLIERSGMPKPKEFGRFCFVGYLRISDEEQSLLGEAKARAAAAVHRLAQFDQGMREFD